MVSETTENEVGVGVVLFLDSDLNIFGDSALDLSEVLVLKLIVVIDEVMGGQFKRLGSVLFGEFGLILHFFVQFV